MAGSAVRTIRVVLTADGKQYVTEMEVAATATERLQSKMERMQSVGRGMSSVGRSMTMLAAPIIGVGAYAAKSAATFQQSMEMIRTQAGQSQATVNSMSRSVLKMAPSLGTTTSALADSLYHVISGGIPAANALQVMSTAAKAAKISGADLTDTTTALTAAVYSGIKGAHNFTSAMGLLNATVGTGDMKMQDLNEAFKGPMLATVKGYGLSLKDVGAALATFGDLNIRGADAATQLRMAVQYMAKPAATAGPELAKLGLTVTSFREAMAHGGLLPALQLLHTRLDAAGVKGNEVAGVIGDLFTKKGAAGVTILENSLSKLESKYPKMSEISSAFGKDWTTTTKNVAFQWDKLKATLQVAMIHVGKAIMPLITRYLPPLVHDIASVAHWFSKLPKPVLDVVAGLTAFLAIGGPILWFGGTLVTMIGTIGGAFKALTVAEVTAGTAMKATIVGVMIVALVLLVTHTKQVAAVAREVFGEVKSIVSSVGQFVGGVFTGLYHVITWPFKEAWKIIQGIAHAIVQAFDWVKQKVGSVFHFLGHNPITDAIGLSGSGGLLHGFGLLHTGGVVKPKYLAMGGPSGTDTIPGWLTPGEGVLNRRAMANVGIAGLQRLNDGGGMGGDITITPSVAVLKLNDREVGQASIRWFATRSARGSSSLTGGAMLTGARTG